MRRTILGMAILLPLAFAGCGKDKEGPGGAGDDALPGDLNGRLIMKINAGDAPGVTRLLGRGASALAEDRDGLPAIFVAAKAGHPGILGSIIAAGADVNSAVEAGEGGKVDGTALGYAAFAGRIEAMALLKDSGADVNGMGPAGTTPLILAAMGGRAEAVSWLLDNGASRGRREALEIARKVKNPAGRYRDTITLLAGRP